MKAVQPSRSWLFVPADRPDRFAKALGSGADVVIFDLEDAVAPSKKAYAREQVMAFVQGHTAPGPMIAVRMNPLGSLEGLADLSMLADPSTGSPDYIVIPKTEGGDALRITDQVLDQSGSAAKLVALIETPRGLAMAADIPGVSTRLEALMFGGADYAAALGKSTAEFRPDYARAVIANSAAIAGLQAIDTPFFAIADPTALAAECTVALQAGFSAKAAIHPSQIEAINVCFTASQDSLAQARRILDAEVDGVALLDGRMVDAAMVRWALRVTAAVQHST